MVIKPIVFALQFNNEKPFFYTESHEKAQREFERYRTKAEFAYPGWTRKNKFRIIEGLVDFKK